MRYLFVIILAVGLLSCIDDIEPNIVNRPNYGFDISHYQGIINWTLVSKEGYSFVFMRATMGIDRKDKTFERNFLLASKIDIRVGAYHYYDPNQNSRLQALNFLNSIIDKKLDLPPVVDIETCSTIQHMDSLIVGVKRFCKIIENELGVKPIIYSGDNFFQVNLIDNFEEYNLWIANYSNKPTTTCEIWQVSQTGYINGIKGDVDINYQQLPIF